MKRMIPALLLAGVAGTSWAQIPLGSLGSALSPNILLSSFNNIDDATNALVSGDGYRGDGIRGAALAALNPEGTEGGNVTQGFNNGNPALQGFAVKLANGTPVSPLADAYVMGTDMVYDILLPAYLQMDGPTAMLVAAGEPLIRPLYDALMGAMFSIDLNVEGSGLPSLVTGSPLDGLPQ